LPAQQADLACLSTAQHLDEAASQRLGQLLYVADTLGQFSRQLGVKGCSVAELEGILDAVAAGAAVGGAVGDGPEAKVVREALAWLACTYQGLLKVRAGLGLCCWVVGWGCVVVVWWWVVGWGCVVVVWCCDVLTQELQSGDAKECVCVWEMCVWVWPGSAAEGAVREVEARLLTDSPAPLVVLVLV
jgi:hypothetical protein